MHSDAPFILDGVPLGLVVVVANLIRTTLSGEHSVNYWLGDGTYGQEIRAQMWRADGIDDLEIQLVHRNHS